MKNLNENNTYIYIYIVYTLIFTYVSIEEHSQKKKKIDMSFSCFWFQNKIIFSIKIIEAIFLIKLLYQK